MQYKTSAEKEADNGEKFFKDFNNLTIALYRYQA